MTSSQENRATLVPFAYGDHLVRTVMHRDEPWFVATDVCRALEIRNPSQAISRLESDEKYMILNPSLVMTGGVITNDGSPLDTAEGSPVGNTDGGSAANGATLTIISEAGCYRLVFTSRKREAEAFKRWLAHDVLPALRRTGRYEGPHASSHSTAPQPVPEPDAWQGLCTRMAQLEALVEGALLPPERLALAVTHMPVWSGANRHRRPDFWSDLPVRTLLVRHHRQMTITEVLWLCTDQFGPQRTPSASAVGRFWQALDRARTPLGRNLAKKRTKP